MRLEIINIDGHIIDVFYFEHSPFKVGDIVYISIKNYNKDMWNVNEVNNKFKIKEIEYFLDKEYSINGTISSILAVSIKVDKISNA